MSPEAELMVACARARMDPGNADRIRGLCRQDIDWESLLRMASRHGMTPLLYWHLRGIGPEEVPKVVLNRLRHAFRHHVGRALFLTGELLQILDLLEGHGIKAIPFKGPVLAAWLYKNLALRPFSDLDILIRPSDVPKARELLITRGYRPQLDLKPLQERAYRWSWCEYVFLGGDGQVVELHWRLAPRYFSFPLDLDRLGDHPETISLGGRQVRTFPPEDWLWVLCGHGTKHLWARLLWISDVAELVRLHPGIDWQRVLSRARALGTERMILLGLYLAEDLLEIDLPEAISRRVQADPAVRALGASVKTRLFREAAHPPGLFSMALFHLRARERLRDRVRYCVGMAVTLSPGDLTAWSLPLALFPLNYVLRPLRLIRKYGRHKS